MVYLQERNLNHAYFQIQYVRLNISEENTSHFLNTFQRSRGAIKQQRHRVKMSKSQEFEDNVLHNVDKIIQDRVTRELQNISQLHLRRI